MIDISVRELNKSYGANEILKGITFDVNRGERVGLIGDNGSGKTTLFKILCGELDYDSGEVHIAPNTRIGMIQQIPDYAPNLTVQQVLRDAFSYIDELDAKIKRLELQMEVYHDDDLLKRYGELTARYEHLGGYEIDTQIEKTANGLGISEAMRAQLFSELSGGEKTRISLARAILQNTDILLLDEPTNHLDVDAVEWLENYLSSYEGTVVIISHDRYFLDRTVKRIIELEDTEIFFYPGNYSYYMEEKQARYLEQKKKYEAEQKKIAQLEFTAQRLHGWGMGNKRLQVRAFAMERRIERLRKTEKPKEHKNTLKASFTERGFHGDEVFITRDIHHSFGDRVILDNINLKMKNGDRIALIGANGSGKTTFLNILVNNIKAQGGAIKFGPSVKAGLLPQVVKFEDEGRNLVDTLIYALNLTPASARNHLAAFDFTGDEVFEKVSTLSGGERSRLMLCLLMAREINLLILDEPTNHLDIISREWIEEAIYRFEGPLLFVSHDRYFLNKFTNKIWALENGKIEEFEGNYEAYRDMCARREIYRQSAPAVQKKTEEKPKTRSKNTEKKIALLEREIAQLEEKLKEIDGLMLEAGSDYARIEELMANQAECNEKLESLYDEWGELTEL